MAANNYYGWGFNTVDQYSNQSPVGYANQNQAIPVQQGQNYASTYTGAQYGPYGSTQQQQQQQQQSVNNQANSNNGMIGGPQQQSYGVRTALAEPTYVSFYENPGSAAAVTGLGNVVLPVVANKNAAGGGGGGNNSYVSGSVGSYSSAKYKSGGGVQTAGGTNQQNRGNAGVATMNDYKAVYKAQWQPEGQTEKNITPVDAAVFSAAKNYMDMRSGYGGGGTRKMYGSWKERFRGGKGPVIDPSEWKYCELCKCTCAGEQAYKSHIQGKNHKKKELVGSAMSQAGSKGHLYCQLCDVACSSNDAYTCHIKGAKHQKILKVQTKMGKPIPDLAQSTESMSSNKSGGLGGGGPGQPAKIIKTSSGVNKVVSTPKINFIGGQHLKTTGGTDSSFGVEAEDASEDVDDGSGPIGQEYILESMNETNTAVQYYCKLCECSVSDPAAKYMHTKGRRHKMQYKKKVDPTLKVDMGTMHHNRSSRNKREPWRRDRKDGNSSYKLEAESLRYEKELLQWQLMKAQNMDNCFKCPPTMYLGGQGGGGGGGHQSVGNNGSSSSGCNSARDNQHIMSKHKEIYPTEQDLIIVQNLVASCEKGLKLVSDKLTTCPENRILKGVMRVGYLAKGLLLQENLDFEMVILTNKLPTKKLMDDICSNLPEQIKTFNEEEHDMELAPDKSYIVIKTVKNPNISCTLFVAFSPVAIAGGDKPKAGYKFVGGPQEKKATLAASAKEDCSDAGGGMREEKGDNKKNADPENIADDSEQIPVKTEVKMELEEGETLLNEDDYVPSEICDMALSALRKAKWFQVQSVIKSLRSGPIILRIMIDFSKRVPTWSPLGQWALEQLVDRVLFKESDELLSPAMALRKIFESVASGILLQDGCLFPDPTEKDQLDTMSHLTGQERENITNSAQHALRMIVFGQIHRVLGIEKLPPPPLMANAAAAPNKRPRPSE